MGIRCFWLDPTERQQLYLRRYVSGKACPGAYSYHNAMVAIEQSPEVMDLEKHHWVDDGRTASYFKGDTLRLRDHRWPQACACGYRFEEKDEWQLFSDHIYRRADTGQELTLRDAPEGAMWEASWFRGIDGWVGDDGRAIMCRVPKMHDWNIDGPSNNCTRPKEPHRCWVRHGAPPNLTVDKNGNTCSAGAGSILTPTWHGFLRNGELVTA